MSLSHLNPLRYYRGAPYKKPPEHDGLKSKTASFRSGPAHQVALSRLATPPVRVTVHQPPTQVVNVTGNDQDYGYSDGAYYEIQKPEEECGDPSFKTVEAPLVGAFFIDILNAGVTKFFIQFVQNHLA